MPTRQRGPAQPSREALADAIVRRHDDIGRRWLERVTRTVVPGEDVTPTELRDSMPEYLTRLAQGLRGAHNAHAGGTSSWKNVAREHADTRVRLGFDIDQLVQEFIVLRQVIFEVLKDEEHVLVHVDQASWIAGLIEGAIAAAVKSYVESRDFDLRRGSAEHIGFMTHELRNPLGTAMLGTTQLRQTLELSAKEAKMFDAVERNQRRLAELIDRVLLLERGTHALRPKRTNVPLSSLIEEPVAAAKVTADAKGVHVEAHFDPDVVVQVDPALTTSAIENVVLNAVKYTDTGEVHIDVEDKPRHVVVHVRDNCAGLSREDLRTIFEPFRRGHHGKNGSGLGLAIARRAVECQGGSIHAESGRGAGCHFWVTLPKPRP